MKKILFALTLLIGLTAAQTYAQCGLIHEITGPSYSCENVASGTFMVAFNDCNATHNITLVGFDAIITPVFTSSGGGITKEYFSITPINIIRPFAMGDIIIEVVDGGNTYSKTRRFYALEEAHPACP